MTVPFRSRELVVIRGGVHELRPRVLSRRVQGGVDRVRDGGIYGTHLKRLLDVALVLASLPIVLPLVGLLALAVALEGGRPFYAQERLGFGGRRFRMWKFRSMVPDAERRLEECLAGNAEMRSEWERRQKLRNDPRITPLGRIMRKTSMDELPQLWNVLKGEMSLVGPRPMLPEQRQYYHDSAYYTLRPGMTGFWQVSERNDSDFAQRARHDANYARALSFFTDLRVIGLTFRSVMRGTGC